MQLRQTSSRSPSDDGLKPVILDLAALLGPRHVRVEPLDLLPRPAAVALADALVGVALFPTARVPTVAAPLRLPPPMTEPAAAARQRSCRRACFFTTCGHGRPPHTRRT